MADRHTVEQRHINMSKIKGRDTNPEVVARHRLFIEGFRYRKNVKSLPGTPDIVLPKYRTVIFVNGCFWHGHEGCKYYVVPKTNTSFWQEKIRRNQLRDEEVLRDLDALGWHVITVWECELRPSSLEQTIKSLIDILESNKALWEKHQSDRAARRKEYIAEMVRKKEQRDLLEKEIPVSSKIRRLSGSLCED